MLSSFGWPRWIRPWKSEAKPLVLKLCLEVIMCESYGQSVHCDPGALQRTSAHVIPQAALISPAFPKMQTEV